MKPMGTFAAVIAALALAACTVTQTPEAVAETPPAEEVTIEAPAPRAPEPPMPEFVAITVPGSPASGTTADWPVPPAPAAVARPAEALAPQCAGAFVQGGLAVCRTLAGAEFGVGGEMRGQTGADGVFVIGFDRDAPDQETIFTRRDGQTAEAVYAIAPRSYSEQVVNGLPQQTVTPDAEGQARIARDRVFINRGYASRTEQLGFLDGFIWPVEGRISGSWGSRRINNGTPGQPHYGVDLAVPTGTPIRAPAAGVVSAAQPDLLREGGLVMIDHGQGLISLYLHMSRLDVTEGQTVAQGDVIGAAGATGRATGPHLCWRLKWRDRYLDPAVAILGLAQARRELAH